MRIESVHHPDIEAIEQTQQQSDGPTPAQRVSLRNGDGAVIDDDATQQQDEGVFRAPPRSASLSYLSDALPPADPRTPTSTSTKRRFFSKRFVERFDWKRQKMPLATVAISSSHSMISAPILQVAS